MNKMMRLILRRKTEFFIGFVVIVVLVLFSFSFFTKPNSKNFEAPGKDWSSPKKVESYFIERLRMTPQEASEIRSRSGVDGDVDLRINTNVTLDALISNLYYYGFIRDQKSFRYALEHTRDITPNNNSLKIGSNGTIDKNAEYRISENMSAWEIADILLNKPSGHFTFDEYNYFFMP